MAGGGAYLVTRYLGGIGVYLDAKFDIEDPSGDRDFESGLTADEVFQAKEAGYQPREYYDANDELRRAIGRIGSGFFSHGDGELFQPIVNNLLDEDPFMLLADYASYVETSEQAAAAWTDIERWTTMSILNAARCGYFSSDRAIQEYCDDIWKVKPVRVK